MPNPVACGPDDAIGDAAQIVCEENVGDISTAPPNS